MEKFLKSPQMYNPQEVLLKNQIGIAEFTSYELLKTNETQTLTRSNFHEIVFKIVKKTSKEFI